MSMRKEKELRESNARLTKAELEFLRLLLEFEKRVKHQKK